MYICRYVPIALWSDINDVYINTCSAMYIYYIQLFQNVLAHTMKSYTDVFKLPPTLWKETVQQISSLQRRLQSSRLWRQVSYERDFSRVRKDVRICKISSLRLSSFLLENNCSSFEASIIFSTKCENSNPKAETSNFQTIAFTFPSQIFASCDSKSDRVKRRVSFQKSRKFKRTLKNFSS